MVEQKISSELIYRLADTLAVLSIMALALVYSPNYFLEGYLATGLGAAMVFGLTGRFTDIYASWSARPFLRDEVMRILLTWLLTFFVLIFFLFTVKASAQYSRAILLTWLLLTPSFLIVNRLVLRQLQERLKLLGINNRNVAIVGMTPRGLAFANALESHPESGLHIAGFYRLDNEPEQIAQHKAIGSIDELVDAACSGTWDQIYLALSPNDKMGTTSVIERLAKTMTPVRFIPDDFTTSLLNTRQMEVANTRVLSLYEYPLTGQNTALKRAEDLLIGGALTLMLLPVMAAIAVAVKISSPGPVLFKQRRHGMHGKAINVWKFRTMTVCENGEQVKQATRGDNRITKLGAFLRRTSLDELPQFFNVIQGDMSIVGPRPHAIAHNEEYKTLIPGYMLRHQVKPGITGWAQINGWRGETDTLFKMEKRLECDLEYIRRWSLSLDLRIILMTAVKTLVDKNAY